MDEIVAVVNEIRDAFTDVKVDMNLNLPQIAVVGSQSSGKSSVLENIVGRDFLPRGSGIVTRCPLVLQLHQLPASQEEEWGEFGHKPGQKFADFAEIRSEIERRTVEIAGGVSISDKPIGLKVYSPHVLTLTLVDLPGLVMNAVGDQPKDIDRQIKEMVTKYVRPSNTIILAVTPANADIATSTALRLAKQVDPDGVRTIGILTKIDLMDRGTDALDMLNGKLVPLRRGFIGVVNRSQADINENKNIQDARADEKKYFQTHPKYSSIADKQGTEYLSRQLNHILMEHIQSELPALKSIIDKQFAKTQAQMEKLGMNDEPQVENGAMLLNLIKRFSESVDRAINGGISDANLDLKGGARLDYVFHESFGDFVRSLRASKDLTDEYIRVNVRNMAGMNASLFPSDQVFFALAREQIQKLENPSIKCVNIVHEELVNIVTLCAAKLERYPQLQKRMIQICTNMVLTYRPVTHAHVRTLIAAEKSYINVKHPSMQDLSSRAMSFMRGDTHANTMQQASPQAQQQQQQVRGGAQPPQAAPQGVPAATGVFPVISGGEMRSIPKKIMLGNSMSDMEVNQNHAIREMVEGYFSIVQCTIADQVPKAINLLMIQKLRMEMDAALVKELYKDNLFTELLSESPDIASQRKGVANMYRCLLKAQTALAKVRDFTPTV